MNKPQELIFIVISTIIIAGLIYIMKDKINDFHIFQKGVILQDINLEKKFNEIDEDYNKITENNNNVANKIYSINNDCQGVFGACSYKESGNTCTKEYIVTKEKTLDGKDCPYLNGHNETCSDDDEKCGVDCIGNWEESNTGEDTIKTFTVTQSKTGRGVSCTHKHGDTEFSQ